nr:disease resistance-like protein DSC1 [Ziziphus jujuba var. spinosa]
MAYVSSSSSSYASPALEKVINKAMLSVTIFSENYASSTWCLDELVKISECREKGQIVIPPFYGVDPSHVRKQKGSYAASKLIEGIVEGILKNLNYKLSISEVKGMVGIEERIKKIESLLCMDSPYVRVAGIYGMGGIGKTTLGCAVCNRLSYQFEKEEKINMGSSFVEYVSIKYRFRRKKVFIVADDVNNSSQIEFLVGDHDQFGYGSRTIVTARNVQVLRQVANDIYRVEGGNTVGTKHLVLSQRVGDYACGNPLAIKVLGSVLYSKSKEEWESSLDKLETIPNKDIQNVLKISYGELDDKERDIFLDIACFFKGYDVDFVQRILDGCGLFASTRIQNLIDESFITIIKNKLWLHDLLQNMGKEIVREESLLNDREIIGSAKVEGIFSNTSEMKEMILSSQNLMHNLRLLKILNFDEEDKCKLKFPQGLRCLPDALTYLYWDGCLPKSSPSDFSPENIVIFQMPNSQLEQLWDGVQDLGKLKEMDLSHSTRLTKILDLSHASNLKTVNLEYCISLLQLSPTLQHHSKLSSLNRRCCSKLEKLPELSRNMKELLLEGCAKIKEIPSSIGSLDNSSL